MTETIWYISIIFTILLWWVWLIFSRKSAAKLDNPFLENFLITFGAFIFNLGVFLVYVLYSSNFDFQFHYFLYPFLSGVIWAFACLFAMIACSKIGVGKAMAIWAPSGMVVSFLWWVLYYGEFSSSLIYAFASVILVIIWISLVIRARNPDDNTKILFSGVGFSIAASLVWWGTYLVPLKELSSDVSVFITLLPLSIGMLVGSAGIYGVKKRFAWLNRKNITIGVPIMLSGFVWAIANLFAIIAVLYIGMWKAYPLAELCAVVNALFAVFFLKEIIHKDKIKIFFLWVFIAIIGAIWLSILKI